MEDFAKAHLAFRVNDYAKSAKHNPRSAYKVYAVDPGLFMAVTQATRDDIAQSLETAVYLELRRRDPVGRAGAICAYRSAQGYEVDFATTELSMVQNISLGAAHGAAQDDKQVVAQGVSFYQVCLSIENPTVRRRELRALTEAMRETGSRSAYLLTLGASEQITTDAGDIRVLPAWRWMLGA
jgi:predicted AAA+ superfamily ATPase